MALTLTIPDELAIQLRHTANDQQLTVEETAMLILRDALGRGDFFPTPEQVVAKIKALPKNPNAIRPAQGSLIDALRDAPDDPDFNLEEWEEAWRNVESELETFDEVDAEVASELQFSLRNKGRQLKTVDALIAAVALRYDLTL